MTNELQKLKDNLAVGLFGETVDECMKTGNCIKCKELALPKCYSDAGVEEYRISGLCEECFDDICGEG